MKQLLANIMNEEFQEKVKKQIKEQNNDNVYRIRIGIVQRSIWLFNLQK